MGGSGGLLPEHRYRNLPGRKGSSESLNGKPFPEREPTVTAGLSLHLCINYHRSSLTQRHILTDRLVIYIKKYPAIAWSISRWDMTEIARKRSTIPKGHESSCCVMAITPLVAITKLCTGCLFVCDRNQQCSTLRTRDNSANFTFQLPLPRHRRQDLYQ